MSRTRRNYPKEELIEHDTFPLVSIKTTYGTKACRDKKCGNKPPSWFKRLNNKIRRSREKQALRNGTIPEPSRKTDVWDWN